MSSDPEIDNKKSSWSRFQRLTVDKKLIRKRLRRAENVSQRHAHKFIIKRLDSLRQSKRHIVTWLAVAALILAGIGLQSYLFYSRATTVASAPGGTYVEGVIGKLETLNPLYASSSAETAASRLMFSSLLAYDNTGHLKPDAAQKVSVDDKGLNYTVKLRDNIYWHDGVKLSAKDVVFTVKTIKDPAARVRSSLRANWKDISVKATDDSTVVFTLPVNYAPFVHALTFPIVPMHSLQQVSPGAMQENAFARSPIGSGPFMFKLLQTSDTATLLENKAVHMTANNRYYMGKPKLDRFEIYTYPSAKELTTALKAHEITAAADLSTGDTADVPNEYKIQSYGLDNAVFLMFNTTSNILKDQKVRKAIQHGLDTAKVRTAAGGNLPANDLPFISGQISGDLPSKPAVDIKKAKEMLEQEGWKMSGGVLQKGDTKMKLRLATTKTQQFSQSAENIKSQLLDLGIDVDLVVTDTANPSANFITNVLQPRDYDMLLYELPIGADPDVYAYWHSSQLGVSGYNFANYKDDTSDTALISARDRLDTKLRDVKYITFAKQWLSDVPAIGLYQQVATYVRANNAHAMVDKAKFVISSDRYANVILWTVEQRSVYKTP